MSEILLLHHALGRTDGVLAFAELLRDHGHIVHVPDAYDGRTFGDVDEGVAHAESVGFGTIADIFGQAADTLPRDVVHAGMSLGTATAQRLAQTRPGARGVLLLHGCVPVAEFGTWPPGLAAQVHTMTGDPWVDIDGAQEFAAEVADAELFLYPGSGHLFAERGSPDFDADAAALMESRVLEFLDSVSAA